MQTNLYQKKADQQLPGDDQEEGIITGNDGYIHNFDHGDGFTDVYVCQN